MITCPKCGAGNRAGAAVCRMCATPLAGIIDAASSPAERAAGLDEASASKSNQEATNSVEQEGITCPECKTFNEVGWSFCQQCGKRLQQPAPTPPSTDWKPADGFRTVASDQLKKVSSVSSELKTAEEEIQAAPVVTAPPPRPPLPPTLITEVERPAVPAVKSATPDPPPTRRADPPQASAPSAPAARNSEAPAKPAAEPASPAVSGVFCTQCGQTNNSGAQYCASCGAPMTAALPQTMVMSSPFAPVRGRLSLVMEGGQEGASYDLADETVIGRASGEMTFPHDGFMSGRHARIVRRGASFVLTDEGSRNGTFIKIKDEVELKPGDMILVGKQLFRFET
ncbi:MAG TPA: zinc ribbon domain-containing protein [Blastocatellia bacterium]|nr:zinc ribbon domain-containing protein [Blastocatellia bacterium]